MSAIRLARAVTGREKLIKFAGAYHGHVDGLLAEAGSGLATQGIPASPGVPAAQAAATIVVPWNDPEAVAAALAAHEVAAILAEPLPANMGVVAARRGLPRRAAPARGRARRAAGPRRGDLGLSGRPRRRPGALRRRGRPDDHGQGAGRRPPRRRLRRAPRADGAGRAGGRRLPGGDAVGQPARGRRRARDAGAARSAPPTNASARSPSSSPPGLRAAAAEADAAVQVASVPGLVTPFFSRRAGARLRRRLGLRPRRLRALLPGLLDRGVYPPASQFEAWFVSLAHDEAAIEHTCEAAAEAFARRPAMSCAPRTRCATWPACCGPTAPWSARTSPSPPPTARPRRARGRRAAHGRCAGRVRARGRGRARGIPAALRRAAGSSAAPTATSRCSRATTSTRSGSSGWRRSATSTRCASSPT